MRTARLIGTLGLALGLLLALAASAQAAVRGDVITYDHRYNLKDPTRIVVQGRPVGAAAANRGRACEISGPPLTLAPKESAAELRQISLNRRTCRAVFERGEPPSWTREQGLKAGKQTSRSSRGTDGGAQALHHQYRWGGFTRAWYQDARNGRIVNQVFSGADWNTTRSGCIGSNFPFFQNRVHAASGWFEVSHRWSRIDDVCRYIISSTNSHFRDNNFSGCSGGPRVDAIYTRVRFVGYPNGGIRGSRTSRIEPSCKDVLIAYVALYRR